MKRVVAFVDGFNLYYALEKSKNERLQTYKWLNLHLLLSRYLQNKEEELQDQ